jgi:hypothetical protein
MCRPLTQCQTIDFRNQVGLGDFILVFRLRLASRVPRRKHSRRRKRIFSIHRGKLVALLADPENERWVTEDMIMCTEVASIMLTGTVDS